MDACADADTDAHTYSYKNSLYNPSFHKKEDADTDAGRSNFAFNKLCQEVFTGGQPLGQWCNSTSRQTLVHG